MRASLSVSSSVTMTTSTSFNRSVLSYREMCSEPNTQGVFFDRVLEDFF